MDSKEARKLKEGFLVKKVSIFRKKKTIKHIDMVSENVDKIKHLSLFTS